MDFLQNLHFLSDIGLEFRLQLWRNVRKSTAVLIRCRKLKEVTEQRIHFSTFDQSLCSAYTLLLSFARFRNKNLFI